MTLIAFACYADRAEVITDTVSYSRSASSLGHSTKQMALTHLDAIVMTQGACQFGYLAKVGCLEAAEQVPTFDELIAQISGPLRDLWARSGATDDEDGTVFLAGYSHAEQAFVAWVYAREHDFVPERVSRPFVMPAPFDMAPSRLEHERAKVYLAPEQHHLLDRWQSRPEMPRPETTQDWVNLATAVRQQRALESFMRVIVAGRVVHTVLRRGKVSTRQIHQFADHGDEFLQLIAWTHHPQAQLMECHCGSGKRFVDCHLAPYLEGPCGCGSGSVFRGCCMVPAGVSESGPVAPAI